jgi:kynurenine formamidase
LIRTVAWHDRGGLVGRGVFLDYKAYADEKGIFYDPSERHVIGISDLEAVAAHEGIEFRQGDILIVRSGLVSVLGPASEDEQALLQGKHTYVGVECTENAARWLWNHHFAAVAGDMLAFEAYPPDKEHGKNLGLFLYPYLITNIC